MAQRRWQLGSYWICAFVRAAKEVRFLYVHEAEARSTHMYRERKALAVPCQWIPPLQPALTPGCPGIDTM